MQQYKNNINNKIELSNQKIDDLNKQLSYYYDEQEKIKKEIRRIRFNVTEYDNPNINKLDFKKKFSNSLYYISLVGAAISAFFMEGSLLLTSFLIGTSVVSKYNLNKTIKEIESYKNSNSNIKTRKIMKLEEESKGFDEKINNTRTKKINEMNKKYNLKNKLNKFDKKEKQYDEPAKVLTLKKRLTK